jgi:uncharacterized protein involved in outer membrane biogenesis
MRIARRLSHLLLLIVVLVVGAAAAAVVFTQTSWFKDWLRGYIVAEAKQYLNGDLSIGRLDGNLFSGVELENVAVSIDGSEVVAIKDLGLDYSLLELLTRGVWIDRLRINRPVVRVSRDERGWSLAGLVKAQEREVDREGPGRPVTVGELGISDATVLVDGTDRAGRVTFRSGWNESTRVSGSATSPFATRSTSGTCRCGPRIPPWA